MQLFSGIRFDAGHAERFFELAEHKKSLRIFVTLPKLDAYYILVAANRAAAKFRVVDGCYKNEEFREVGCGSSKVKMPATARHLRTKKVKENGT